MTVQELQERIKKKTLDNLYIFTGEETAVLRLYLDKAVQSTGCTSIIRADAVQDITSKLSQKSFIATSSVYIIYNDYDFYKTVGGVDKLQRLIENNCVFLIYSTISKSDRFYKDNKDAIIIFERLGNDVLMKHISKQINLSGDRCEMLIKYCDSNYDRILSEIEKLKCYAGTADADWNSLFDEFINNGVIYRDEHFDIFEFCNLISGGYIREVFEKCRGKELLLQNDLLGIISVLYNNIKNMLVVQSYRGDSRYISDITGLSMWQINKIREVMGAYTINELLYIMKFLHKLEQRIKVGEIDMDYALDYMLVGVL